MENFSQKQLKPRHAIISGIPGDVSITILICPFLHEREIVDTSIRLDGIDIPSTMLHDLSGKSFSFPVEPDRNSIDGSIYLESAHHPIDVTSLSFSKSRTGYLTLIVKGVYLFEFEKLGSLENTAFTLAVNVSLCTV